MTHTLCKVAPKIVFFFFLFGVQWVSAQNCSVNAGIDETICENITSFNLSGSSAGLIQNGPTWSQVGGPSVLIDNPSDLSTIVSGFIGGNVYRFRLTAQCTDGSTQFQEVNITVESITTANAGMDIASCPDNTGSLSLAANTPTNAGETGFWSIDGANNAGVTINSPTAPNSTISLSSNNAGTSTLRWTITGAPYAPGQFCESSDVMTVTNFGGVTVVNAGADQNLDNCYTVTQSTGLNASFGGNNINGQVGTWSFVSGPNTPTFSNINSNRSGISNLIEGTYTLRWSVNGPCATGEDTMTITVAEATQDITDATVQDSSIRFCDPSITTTTLIGSQPQFAGETVQWTQISGPGVSTAGTPASILTPMNSTTQVSGLASPGTYEFSYTITNATTGCDDTAISTVRYSVDPITITANGGADITAACGITQVEIPFTTTGNGTNTFAIISGPSGSALIDPNNFQNTGSTPLTIDFDVEGTYTVVLRRAVGGSVQTGCDVGTDAINVAISLNPTASNAGTPQVLACNVTSTSITGNIVTTGQSLWSQISGPNNATFSDPFARTSTVSGLIPGTYVFQYGITGGNACSPSAESTVSVEVSSNTPLVIDAGPDQPLICFGAPIALAGETPPTTNLVGTWTVDSAPAGATIVFEDENDPNTLVSGLDIANETYIFRWTVENPNDNTCPPPGTDTVTITTGATEGPSLATAGSDECLAPGTPSVVLAANQPEVDEVGTWTANPSTGISFADPNQFNTTATISIEQSYILTWTISKAGCQSTSDDVEITIGVPANADAGADQTACSDTFTMAATSSTGDGLWTQISGPGGFTIDDESSPTAQFTFSFSGQYVFEWIVNNGTCTQDSDQVTLNVGIPSTIAAVGADQVICNATNAVLSGNSFDSNVETGFWTLLSGAPNTPTITDINDPNTAVTDLVSGVYNFRWTITGSSTCPTTFDDVQIEVFAPPGANETLQLCEVNNFLLEATFGATGTWTQTGGPAGATVTQNPTNSNVAEITITPGNIYQFTFTTDYACGTSTKIVDVISSTAPSQAPNAGPDQILCIGDLVVPNQTTLAGNTPPIDVTTATWRFAEQPAGSVAVIDNPNSPTSTVSGLSVTGVYILEWNFESGNCSETADIIRIEVYEAPSVADAGADQTNACQLDVQLNAAVPAVGIGTWTFTSDPSGGAAIIDNPNSPTSTLSNITALGTYELTWTVSNGNVTFVDSPSACDPTSDTVNITFTADAPSAAEAGPDQEFCDAIQTNLNATALTVGTGTWSQTAGPGVTDAGTMATIAGANDPNTPVSDLGPGTYEFTWTVENGGCTLVDTMELVIFADPISADAGPDQTLNQFSAVTLAAVPPTAGTGTWTQVSGPTTVGFSDTGDPNTEVFGATEGVYTFQWTVSNGICTDVSDTVEVSLLGVDLELSKSVSPTTANPGDIVTFTIEVFNNDVSTSSDATGVEITDIIPSGFTLVPGTVSPGGVYNLGNLSITWSNLSIPNGSTTSLSFDATVNASGSYTNTAEITANAIFDLDSTVGNGIAAEDDQDTATVTVAMADLRLRKSVAPTDASVGETVTFSLQVRNFGPDTATGVEITDIVPPGYTIGTINDGGVQNGNEIKWSGLTLNSGNTTVSFEATVNPPTGSTNEYLNTAQITASDVLDPDSTPNNEDGDQSEDDESAAGITLENADLELSKSVSSNTGNLGDQLTYTIAVLNNDTVESGDATGVTIVDTLPNGLDIVGGTISNGGVYNPGNLTITWSDLSIANGSTLNLSYEVTVNASGNYTNVAQITASDLPDPDSTPNNDNGDQSEDDEANASFALQTADLSLVKDISSGSSATPNVGDTVVFELTLTNAGPDVATNVRIEDIVPSGYTLGTINNGGTAIAGTFLSWNLPSLAVGSTTLSYEVTVNAPSGLPDEYLNIAEIVSSDQQDPDSEPGNDDGDQDEDDEDFFIIVPQIIDLELNIQVSDNTPNVGDIVTFTINLSNLGDVDATGVNIQDLLPPGFGNVTGISNGGILSGSAIDWSGLSVPMGTDTLILTFNAEVPEPSGASNEYQHRAQVTGTTQEDLDSSPNNDNGDQSEDDEDAISIAPQMADLSIEKTANTTSPNVGDTVTFTLTITNSGPDVATGVAVEDILPSGFNLTAVNNGGTLSGNTASWTGLSILANNGSITLSYAATVNAPTGAVNEYVNNAQITASDQFDPDSDPSTGNTVDEDGNGSPEDDDEDSLTLTPAQGDLSLTKIVVDNDLNPQIGTEISFEITVFNDGPNTADNVVVQDLLPTGFDFVLYSATSGIYNATTGIWQVGDVTSGSSETIVIDVLVNATGNYTNVAEVIASDVFDPDSTPNNNVLAEDDQDSATVTPVNVIDIELEKSVNNSTPDVNTNVTFTLTLTNTGLGDATNVQVLDQLPSGFTYVSDDGGGAYDDSTGNWNIGNVSSGASATLNIIATVNATGVYTNVAQVVAHNELDTDSTPNNNILSEDDQDEVTLSPRQVVDLTVTKVANTMTPNIGGQIEFTISVNNDGPSDATGVVVTDLLRSGYQLVSAIPSTGTYEPLNGSWSIGNLANGATETMAITATVLANGNYTNTAELTGLNENDSDSEVANNDNTEDDQETIAPIPVLVSDLELSKSVDNSTPLVGSEVIFTLDLTNNGPSDVSAVLVQDLLPTGYLYISNTGTAGTYNPNTGIWNLNGTIPNGTTETLNIVARVNPTGNYENIAEIISSGNQDIDSTPSNGILSEDDQDSVSTTPVPIADLSLTKIVDNAFPDVSENITFTLTLTNTGSSEATGIQVQDLLPSGFNYISDTGAGAYNDLTGIWNVGSLAADTSTALNITVSINTTGSYINTTELIAVNEVDPDSIANNNVLSEDDQDAVEVIPGQVVDISVTKVANTMTPNIGGQIEFTVNVSNDGPSDATGVVVTDFLRSGYQLVSAVPSTGTYEPLNGSWAIGNLANGATETMVITATVLANGNYSNTAELTGLNENDSDSEVANNDNTEDDQETIAPTPVLVSDLELTKTVNNATPFVGDEIIFTLNITNNGPSNATGVQIQDILPSGYTYISNNSTSGVYDQGTGIWNLNGAIPNGTTETLNIVAFVNPTGNYENIAEVISSANLDTDSTPSNGLSAEDDQDSALTTPTPIADLSLLKTVDNEFPDVSDNVTFTLTLNNAGPSIATGVQVQDLLPSGYRYIADSSGGTYNSTTGIWNVGALTANTSTSLDITVGINTTGSYVNRAEVIAVNEMDPDSSPNNNILSEDDEDEQATLPRVITDISLTKNVDNLSPSVGSQVTFTIEVTNDGPSDATGLVVEDILASGYNFISATTSVGTYDEIIGSWNIASLANGATETLEIRATVLTNGDFSNTAELIALDTFDPDSSPDNNLNSEDDQDTVNPIPTGLADLSLTKTVDEENPNVGDIIEFTVNLTNSGDSDATGIVVTDLLPSGFTYESHFTTAGIYDEVNGLWNTNGVIPNGTTETLVVLVSVNPPSGVDGEYTNIAQITAADQSDPDSTVDEDIGIDDLSDGLPDDDEAMVVVIPQSTDIALQKTVDNDRPGIGSTISFTIIASNVGSSTASNIGIEEILPSGYTFISATASAGNYDFQTGAWSIATLAASNSETLIISAEVLDSGEYLNTARLAFVDQYDIDASNNTAQATIDPSCLVFYNEFSPNGDGVNETFTIDCISRYPNNVLRIYNRWGNLVFEAENYNNDWNGTSTGRATIDREDALPVGTYFYILDLGDGSEPISDWLYINR
ncbi:PKD domain-containing protein [Spongiimicrobium salis]|uniref:PKD domain-containing protein n=1 Tax=Spongiimicrobium salis TaxID=1667022 RepID=UPI00374D362F